jgi:hypothetical protein
MNDKKEISKRMKEYDEKIEDFFKRQKNNNWENYNFLDMCISLHLLVINNLITYGQVSEYIFLRASLQKKFSYLTYDDIDNGYVREEKKLVVDDNGNEVYQILHTLPIYKKYEIMLFHELNKKYRNDPDILNLKEISDYIYKIIKCNGKDFSQQEIITIIDKGLKSKTPGGPIWIRYHRKN